MNISYLVVLLLSSLLVNNNAQPQVQNPCINSTLINSMSSDIQLSMPVVYSTPENTRVSIKQREILFLCCAAVLNADSQVGSSIYWTTGQQHGEQRHDGHPGYSVEQLDDTMIRVYYNSLRVDNLLNYNDTIVTCTLSNSHGSISSEPKVLIVMGPPSPPFPRTSITVSGAIRLSWAPVFSWQEYPVTGYTIKVTGESIETNETTFDQTESPQSLGLQDCEEITFAVIASNELGESQPGNATGGFPKLNAVSNFNSTIDTFVLFTHNLEPRVYLSLMLPHVCPYQTLNYTISLDGMFNHTRQSVHIEEQIDLGSLENFDELLIEVSSALGFAIDETYTVHARLYTDGGETTATKTVTFNTDLPQPCNITEKTMLYVLGAICASLFVGLLLFLCGVCTCWIRKKGCLSNSKRTSPGMVNNPIYDGPIYDSVYNERGRLISSAATTPTSDGIPEFPPVMAATNNLKLMENSLESQFGDPKQPLEPRYSSSAAATENAECYVKMKGKFASDVGDGLETVADKEQDVNLVRVTDV